MLREFLEVWWETLLVVLGGVVVTAVLIGIITGLGTLVDMVT